jgi:hypothetical protein
MRKLKIGSNEQIAAVLEVEVIQTTLELSFTLHSHLLPNAHARTAVVCDVVFEYIYSPTNEEEEEEGGGGRLRITHPRLIAHAML